VPSVIVFTEDAFATEWDLGGEWSVAHWETARGVPDVERLRGLDYAVAVGPFQHGPLASELGGALRLLAESGAVAIFLYPGRFEGANVTLFEQLMPGNEGYGVGGSLNPVSAVDQAFSQYLTAYGRAHCWFKTSTQTEALGSTSDERIAAVAQPAGSGAVYVLPYFVGNFGTSYNGVIGSLLRAIEAHRTGSDDVLPEYVKDIRLPGEDALIQQITQLEAQAAEAKAQAARLRGFRHLIGTASGPTLEKLIIEALNIVLEDTDLSAEDRMDIGAEDFWLVSPAGDRALAEAKGVSGHVRRQNVNQVDNHREEHGFTPEDMPGLLVVNVFRNTDGEDAAQRSLPVSPDVVANARRNNVLVLRTSDLFKLLDRRLAGENVGEEIEHALDAGGGWLEAKDQESHLHT
jgi:hypothetical protein